MGWSTYTKPRNVKADLDGGFRKGVTVLASALKGFTYYAALQLEDSAVVATVALVRYSRDGTISVKWIDETAGPVESECPANILDMLTPTDSEWANKWRGRCRANLELRGRISGLKIGDAIKLAHPMRFNNGQHYQEFTLIEKKGTSLVAVPAGKSFRVRISRAGLARALGNS